MLSFSDSPKVNNRKRNHIIFMTQSNNYNLNEDPGIQNDKNVKYQKIDEDDKINGRRIIQKGD